MSRWTPQRVQDAAAAWVWVPDDADAVRTDEYHLIRYPSHYVMPTQVAWSRTSRPADAVIDDVANRIRKWRLDEVDWWTSSATSPADTEEALLSRGATVVDIVDVLAYDMSADGVARLWGAATRPPWRHRGAYRAVLEHRMRIASQHGATLALVRGRVETSGPILRRLGFERYGEERCYRLPVT